MTASSETDIVTAAILVIGDEILSGRTKDKNIGTIADHLTAIGIRLREVRVVADEEADIVAAVNALRERYDYVFTTGGIGPTHDDITADSMAKAFGVAIDVDPRAVAMLRERHSQADLTPARLRMARIPGGAELVAPGQTSGFIEQVGQNTSYLIHPEEILADNFDAPEGTIAPHLTAAHEEHPDVQMGSYPYFENGRPAVYLVLRATDHERLEAAAQALEARLGAADLPHERRAPASA